MKYWLPALVVLFSTGIASSDGRIAKWDAFSSGEGSAAVDCQNCPEDEYIRFFCPMFSKQINVRIPGVVLPGNLDEGAPIDIAFDIDGETSTHPGRVNLSEMFGSVSTLSLGKADPLFGRLKQGSVLTISIEGTSVQVPLTGSKAAIEELLIGCE